MPDTGCPLCDTSGGVLLFQGPSYRLIRAEEAGFPAFYRLVWNRHVAEFSDLSPADRLACMEAVAEVEACLRRHLQPTKINLAALGNMVPHLHWHIIARFSWDSHFPAPVWSPPQREVPADALQAVLAQREALERELLASLASRPENRPRL